MSRTFTPEQAAAIERREGPLLLSANAGSGKTTVLAERFALAVAQDGLRPTQLLAITFTEKAAGELRQRIRTRLAEQGDREAARELEAAWISTIHGFCARLLRAEAVTAGLDPGFAVADAAAQRRLRQGAFDRALGEVLDADRDAGAALELAATWTVDRLRDAVSAVHDELRSQGQTVPRLPPAVPRRTVPEAVAALEAARATALAHLQGARDLKSIRAALDALGRCAELLGAGVTPTRAQAAGLTFTAGSTAELKDDACAAYNAAVGRLQEALVDDEALAVHAGIGDLLDRYAAAYAEAKAALGLLDFDDLELRARDLLASRPGLRDGWRARFARIMVDEFQDTNPLQLELLDLLDTGHTFVVGDALQSIYGFRHADVEGFRSRRRTLALQDATAALQVNWRSSPELLETLNGAFGPLHDDASPLVPGRTDLGALPGGPRVELLAIDTDAWEADPALAEDPAAARALAAELAEGLPPGRVARHAEARAVARRVAQLVREEGVAPGEIAILLRSAGELGLHERALEAEGLPTLAAGGRGFWSRQAVGDLTAHLALLANPLDETALLSVLASPLAGLSSDALALIAAGARARGTGLWDVVRDGPGEEHRLASRDAVRLGRFRDRFLAERAQAGHLGLDELLVRVVEATGYDEHLLRGPGGRRALANVAKLVRLASAYEATHGRDVRGFIDRAHAELEADAREADAPVELGAQDAVRLMTIHAAKGLEFGVVVVPDLGRKGESSAGDVLVGRGDPAHPAGRVGLRLVSQEQESVGAFAHDELRREAQAAEREEERRVFHVAFTRAEQRLILSGGVTLGRDWPREAGGACPWSVLGPAADAALPYVLTPAEPERVLDEHRPGGRVRLRERLVTPATWAAQWRAPARAAPVPAPAPPAVEAAAPVQLDLFAPPAPLPAGPPPPAPPRAPAVGALSYSGLHDHAACGYRFYLQRVLGLPRDDAAIPVRLGTGGLDGRVRGTLVHVLLEELDLHEPQPPSEDRIAELAAGLGAELSASEVEDVRRLVDAFATTPLAQRLRGADEVRREDAFAFELSPGGILLNGFVDLRALEGERAIVVDYKTDRLAPEADTEAVVRREYGAQRAIYALAELRAGAGEVEVHHLFLERPGEPAVVRYGAADAGALQDDLLARAAAIARGEFPVSAEPHAGLCLGCPGRRALCVHPTELTGRALVPAEALDAEAAPTV